MKIKNEGIKFHYTFLNESLKYKNKYIPTGMYFLGEFCAKQFIHVK